METIKIKYRPKSVYKLNPLSDRFRVCPQCGEQHMVTHRSRDFCSDKCCDDYNNQKKRLAKQAEILVPQLEILIPENCQPTIQVSHPPINGNEANTDSTVKQEKTDLERNFEILNLLTIDTVEGTHFYIEDLVTKGFNFYAYSEKETLFNIPEPYESYCLKVESFLIFLIENNKVLIIKK